MIRASRLLQDADGGGEVFDGDVVSGCPSVPGVEGGDGVLCAVDPLVEPVEGPTQPSPVPDVVAQLVGFVLELGALGQDRLGAAGSFVEDGLGGVDVVGGVGEFTACRPTPEDTAVGEFAFGEAPMVPSPDEFGVSVGDGAVVGFAARGELAELVVESVEPVFEVGVVALVSLDG